MTRELLTRTGDWEQRLSDLYTLAAAQPIVGAHERAGRQHHQEHRGAFHQRFLEIQRVRSGEATEAEVFYVRMIKERFGYDVIRFYEQNEELCDAICEASRAKQPYDDLVQGCNDIADAEVEGSLPPGTTQNFQQSVDYEVGLEAVGMYYWDRLNPLVEQAYALMDQQTLNASFLTR